MTQSAQKPPSRTFTASTPAQPAPIYRNPTLDEQMAEVRDSLLHALIVEWFSHLPSRGFQVLPKGATESMEVTTQSMGVFHPSVSVKENAITLTCMLHDAEGNPYRATSCITLQEFLHEITSAGPIANRRVGTPSPTRTTEGSYVKGSPRP